MSGNRSAVRFPRQITECITGVVPVSDVFAVDFDRSLVREAGRIREENRRAGYGEVLTYRSGCRFKFSGACKNNGGNGIVDRGIKGREGIRSRSATPQTGTEPRTANHGS